MAPAERMNRLRQTLRKNLETDLKRWLPAGTQAPSIVYELLESGWTIDTKFQKNVRRDWYSVIAIAFVEKLKTTPRLATVFEAKILSEIAVREPAARPMATLTGFAGELDQITAPLQRIEDSLGIISRDVTEIREDVKEIRRTLSPLGRVPRIGWVLVLLLIAIGSLGLAMQMAPTVVCVVPGVRTICGEIGIGGAPKAEETKLWQSRVPGDCSVLREYITKYPHGAYAAEAHRRLTAMVSEKSVSWEPNNIESRLPVLASLTPFSSEDAARADALRRAQEDAKDLCAPYRTGDFQLKGARVEANADGWRCSKRTSGFYCSFVGMATCEVNAKRVDDVEKCQ